MSAFQRVAVRVDASIEMGTGHLTRCMSLANELAAGGAKVTFLLRGHVAAFADQIEACGHQVILLPDPAVSDRASDAEGTAHARWLSTTWRHDAEQTSQAIDQIGALDWLIVDHYALDARWERAQRRKGLSILAIDDLADRSHDCDILLDQNLVSDMETRYQSHVPVASRRLLGPSYALLRPDFAEARKSLPGRSGKVRRLLVCYGGSDPTNETTKALAAIRSLSDTRFAVDVVVGSSNPYADLVARLCLELPDTYMHRGANNMAELMSLADLAIGAGGVMSWERCCLGLPTIAVGIAENQIGGLTALAQAGALLHLGPAASVTQDRIESAIRSFLSDAARTKSMGEVARGLVDGKGTSRVRDALDV